MIASRSPMSTSVEEEERDYFMVPAVPRPVLVDIPSSNPMQHELLCILCQDIPMDVPITVTLCGHSFCQACIQKSLSYRSECPTCRTQCYESHLKPVEGLGRRVWEQVPVACPHSSCDWKGPIGNYKSHHVKACIHVLLQQAQRDAREEAEAKHEVQVRKLEEALEMTTSTMVGTITRMKADLNETQTALARLQLQQPFLDPGYNYDRLHIVELTKYICFYLEDRPHETDANKIFNCIHNCQRDFEKKWADNPECYWIDLRMLLNVCLATVGWFSQKQMDRMRVWNQKLHKECGS